MKTTIGRIISALDDAGRLSRHELAHETGLTRTTVTNVVMPLVGKGLLEETEPGVASRRGGPRPTPLGINPSALRFVGLDIRREKQSACLIDLTGEMVDFASRTLPMGASRDDVLGTIDSLLNEMVGRSDAPVASVGIGSIGPILESEGLIHSRHFTALEDVNIVEHINQTHGLSTSLQIGAVAAAYGEERIAKRQNRPANSVAFIVVDYAGIGLGLISGGAGWISDHGGIGELGHMSIERNGRPCNCGRKGCLVQYASGRAMLRALGVPDEDDEGTMLSRVAEDAEAGDPAARSALLEAGEYLGYGLVDVDRLLRPGRIVLGSSHPKLADWYLRGARRYIDSLPETEGGYTLPERLFLSERGTAAIAYGAAAQQLEKFLAAPDAHIERLPIRSNFASAT